MADGVPITVEHPETPTTNRRYRNSDLLPSLVPSPFFAPQAGILRAAANEHAGEEGAREAPLAEGGGEADAAAAEEAGRERQGQGRQERDEGPHRGVA